MKNKKLLLIATAAMSVVALGVAGVGTAAWFTASGEATTKANTVAGTLTTAQTSATVSGILFTVARTSADSSLQDVQLTDNSGKTAYYLDSTLHDNITPTKGYATVVYSITASRSPDSGDLTLQQLLVNLYNNTASHKIYLRVTAGSQARVATSTSGDTGVYAAGQEGATVTVACDLSSTGATTSWSSLTVYASVKATTTEENFANAATLYANATLSATVGSDSAAFTPAA